MTKLERIANRILADKGYTDLILDTNKDKNTVPFDELKDVSVSPNQETSFQPLQPHSIQTCIEYGNKGKIEIKHIV